MSEIDPGFIKKLKKVKLKLSAIEILLLYYRKNNFTYKEIALITNKTLRSIQSTSYRLNKKITEEMNYNIDNFLKKI